MKSASSSDCALPAVGAYAASAGRGGEEAAAPPRYGRNATDAELLEGVLDESVEAWEVLVRRYSGLLLSLARRTFAAYGYEASEADVEDAVAEVWANLLEKDRRVARQCRQRANLPQTLHVLARHRSVDLMRRRGRQEPVDFQADPRRCLLPVVEAPPEEDDRPRRVRQAIEQLSERQRRLVRLFFLQGRSYREIEALTAIPGNSIGPTLSRAVARLKRLLGQD
jgi:RNA polymerase sigma-70 factor (ECF subfamily)